jgi:AhpD family alkylhydroperoxidase
MKTAYPEMHVHLQKVSAKMARELTGPMTAFGQLHAAATAPAALDTITKELIALGIAISTQCEGCIAYHVHDALQAGAKREQILETIGVAILMGGGPAMVYGCKVLEATDQFLAKGHQQKG